MVTTAPGARSAIQSNDIDSSVLFLLRSALELIEQASQIGQHIREAPAVARLRTQAVGVIGRIEYRVDARN